VKSAQDAMLGFGGGYNFGASQIGGFPLSYSSRRSSSSGGSGSPTSPPSPPHPMLSGKQCRFDQCRAQANKAAWRGGRI
jgi:hypothetical protein